MCKGRRQIWVMAVNTGLMTAGRKKERNQGERDKERKEDTMGDDFGGQIWVLAVKIVK